MTTRRCRRSTRRVFWRARRCGVPFPNKTPPLLLSCSIRGYTRPDMKKVLLLHMGGTLGMQGSPLSPGTYSQKLVERVPELAHLAELDIRIIANLDSSDVGPEEWSKVAAEI